MPIVLYMLEFGNTPWTHLLDGIQVKNYFYILLRHEMTTIQGSLISVHIDVILNLSCFNKFLLYIIFRHALIHMAFINTNLIMIKILVMLFSYVVQKFSSFLDSVFVFYSWSFATIFLKSFAIFSGLRSSISIKWRKWRS